MNISAYTESLFDIQLSSVQLEQFTYFQNLLTEWNAHINLTSITVPEEIAVKHFLDSLAVALVWKGKAMPRKLVDIGSGAGFPGIPLAIAFPNIDVTLIESIGKKVRFLETVVTELQLRNVRVLHGRAEDFSKLTEHRGVYDIAVARAVAPLVKLVPLLRPFVLPGGQLVAMKGEKVLEELNKLGKSHSFKPHVIRYLLPGESSERGLVRLYLY